METAVECFLISIKEKYKKEAILLDNIDGKNGNLLNVIEGALKPYTNQSYNGLPEKTAKIEKLTKTAVNIQGIMKTGEHGLASDVFNIKTGKNDYSKGKEHADMAPFSFRVAVPQSAKRGILALQRTGKAGIKGIFTVLIQDEFQKKYPNFRLSIAPLVPDFVMAKYMKQGQVKSLTFVKHSIPPDISDVVSGKNVETDGSIELTIKASNPGFFQAAKIAKAVNAKAGVKSVYAMDKFDPFEPDDVKMSVNVDGKIRTVNLNDWSKLKASFDITDEVYADVTGYPSAQSVAKAMDTVIKELAVAAGIAL